MKLAFLLPLAFPAMLLPQLGASTQLATSDRPNFEDVYVNPQLERLKKCETAKLDVYFQYGAVTQHSAEYLTDATQIVGECNVISVKIMPIIVKGFTPEERSDVEDNAEELGAWLGDLGVKYEIDEPTAQNALNNLTYNGRTAQIRFDVAPADRS